MSEVRLVKPAQGEHVRVNNAENAPIICAFSAQQAAIHKDGQDIVFTFEDGSVITVSNYYGADTNAPEVAPLITMDGEAVNTQKLFSAETPAETPAEASPQPAPSHAPTNAADSNVAQPNTAAEVRSPSSSSSPSASASTAALEGARFRDYETSDLMEGINRLPGLDLPWAQKFYESRVHHGGWENSSGDVLAQAPVPPEEESPPSIVLFSKVVVVEAGVSGGNNIFAGTPSGSESAAPPPDTGSPTPPPTLEFKLIDSTGAKVDSITTPYGTITINPLTGEYTYTLNNAADVVNQLGAGQTHDDVFKVSIENTDTGSSSTQYVGATIEGTNDMPTISPQVDAVTERGVNDGGNAPEAGKQVASGSINAQDVDGDSLTYTFANGSTSHVGTYGTFTLNPQTGEYTYTLHSIDAVNQLQSGDHRDETVSVTVTDSHGATSSADLTVTVHGTNDRPTIDAPLVSMKFTEGEGGISQSGTVRASDVDDSRDDLSYGFTSMTGTDQGDTLTDFTTGTAQGTYGSLVLRADGTYIYTLNNAVVDALKSGQQVTETFYIAVKDSQGAFDIKPVTITIDGTNSAPQFGGTGNYVLNVEEAGVDFGTNTDKAGKDFASGTAAADCVDAGATLVYSLQNETGKDANGNSYLTTAYGTLTVNKITGEYSYKLNNDSAALNELQSGQNHVDKFIIVVTNTDTGASNSRDIDVTINGNNDRPIITGTGQAEDIVQGGEKKVTGTMGGNDPEDVTSELKYGLVDSIGQESAAKQTIQGEYGYLQLNYYTGEWTYVLEKDISFLGAGESPSGVHAEKFIVRVTDKNGAFTDKEITINIEGKDDKVTLNAVTGKLAEDTGLDANGHITISGKIQANDVDVNDTQSYAIDRTDGVAQGDGSIRYEGQYGYILFKPDGSYTYVMTKNADLELQHLNVGGSVSDKFSVTVTSGNGTGSSTATENITITIEGTNDDPVLSVVEGTDTVKVTDAAVSNTCVATGKLDANDVDDAKGSLVFRFMNKYEGEEASQPDQNAEGTYGSIAICPTGEYTYTLNLLNMQAIKDALAQWKVDNLGVDVKLFTITETFQVTVTDPQGGTDTKNLVVTIPHDKIPFPPDGSGPDEHLVDSITAVALDVTEDKVDPNTGVVSAKGQVVVVLTEGTMESHGYQYAFKVNGEYVQSISNEYGTITLNPVTGVYVYTLNNASMFVQALAASYSGKEPFTICVLDKWGKEQGNADGSTVEGKLDVIIKGANDAPIIDTLENLNIAKDVGAGHTVTGKAEAHDVDTGDTQSYSYSFGSQTVGVNGVLPTAYGTLTISADGKSYTYELSATGLALLKTLGQGDTRLETIKITVTDDFGETVSKDITITITGSNDAPTLSFGGDGSGKLAIGEDQVGDDNVTAVVSVKGKVVGDDVNAGEKDSLTYSLTNAAGSASSSIMAGTYGTMTIDSTGEYTYMLNNAIAGVQSLGEGVTRTETFYVKVTDHHGGWVSQAVTVTVTGTNDAPTLSMSTGDTQWSITEGSTEVLKGQAVGKDVDIDANGNKDEASLLYSFGKDASGNPILEKIGTYGTFTIDPNTGEYTYKLHDNATVDGLKEGQVGTDTVKVVVTDKHGDTSNEVDVNVSVQGKNDVPDIDSAPSLTITENADMTATATATVHANDVDGVVTGYWLLKADGTYTKTLTTEHGTVTIDTTTGKYIYTLTDPWLSTGQTGQDSFKVVATDEYGASAPKEVNVTINGADDTVVVPPVTTSTSNLSLALLFTDGNSMDAVLPTFTAQDKGIVDDSVHIDLMDMQLLPESVWEGMDASNTTSIPIPENPDSAVDLSNYVAPSFGGPEGMQEQQRLCSLVAETGFA